MPTLFYFHDPMCSWCWGYRPTWLKLQELLPSTINVEYVVGGLAADSNEQMPNQMADSIQSHWRRIESELGAQFNYDFWALCKPRRSTYPSCRAVIAAERQNSGLAMTLAIQQAYYLQAKNPSNVDVLICIASDLNLDIKRFKSDIASITTEQKLTKQINLAKEWQVPGFPSLVLTQGESNYPIPVNYKDAEVTRKLIMKYI